MAPPSGFTLTAEPTFQLIRSCIRSPSVTVSRTYNRSGSQVSTTYTRVDAPAIAVIWRSEDMTSTSTTSGLPTTNNTTPEPTPTENPHDNPTIIALATVVPIVLIALSILAFIIFRRRARQNRAIPISPSFPEISGNDVFQMGDSQVLAAPIELETLPTQASEFQAIPAVDAALPRSPPSQSRPPATPVFPATGLHVNDELQLLQSKRGRVNEHRERLLRLEALEAEDRELEQMINDRMSGRAT